MKKYRKKPIVIEAFQITRHIWPTDAGWPQWAREAWGSRDPSGSAIWREGGKIYCGTLEGALEITFDDWVIQGVKGEIYPCKPDIFDATYEPVSR